MSQEYSFYFDAVARQVIKLPATVTEVPPTYMLIPESHALALIEGEKQGGTIYLNTAGSPAVYYPPPKPVLKWDETATLTPVTVSNGIATQIWQTHKLSIPDKLEKVKELRNYKLVTIPFQMAIATPGPNGEKVYKGCITDPGTTQMFTLSVITATINPGYIFRNWKFDDGSWHPVKGEDLIEAWSGASIQMEKQFDIEAIYSQYITAGIEVDITQWEELPPLPFQ